MNAEPDGVDDFFMCGGNFQSTLIYVCYDLNYNITIYVNCNSTV